MAKPQYTPHQVAAIFTECVGTRDVRSPEPAAFVLLTAALNDLIRHPWDDASVAKMVAVARERQADRKALATAGAILRRERQAWPALPAFDGHRRRWDEAIDVLAMRRGLGDDPHMLPVIGGTNSRSSGKAIAAGTIAGHLTGILRGHNLQVSFRATGYQVAFVRRMLEILYPGEALPSNETLRSTIKNYLKVGAFGK